MFEKLLAAFRLSQAQRDEIRAEINLRNAVRVHLAWKARLMEYLEGRSAEELQPDDVSAEDRCELGKWIRGPGKARLGGQPLFQQLVDEHAKFHYHASRVVEAHQASDEARAQRILAGSFAEHSRSTINCLSRLNAIVEGEQPATKDH